MGFENRDYYRDSEWRPETNAHSVLRWLIGLNVLVLLAQMVSSWQVTEWLSLTTQDTLPRWQLWRLVTYAFCHDTGNPLHLVFNMICVWFFGRVLLDRLGSREFLSFYLVSAVVAGLSFLALHAGFLRERAFAVGASGAVMAIMALFAMWYPRQQVLLMGLWPIEIRWLIAAFVVFDTLPIWGAISGRGAGGDGVAHAAHLGGLLFGFAYQIFELRLSDWLSFRRVPTWWRNRERRQTVRLYTPDSDEIDDVLDPEDLERKVDDVLRKIHEQGEASLTSQERQILTDASRRYRERQRLS